MADTKESSKEMENARKSSRLQQKSKFEKRMNMFVMKSKKSEKRKIKVEAESDGEIEENDLIPEKIPKRDNGVKAKPRSPKKKIIEPEVKIEVESDEEIEAMEDDEAGDPSFNLEMFDLHRVGDEMPKNNKGDGVLLNRRGMPQRIRKKNRLFFDDNVVNIPIMKQRQKRDSLNVKVKEERRSTQKPRSRPSEKKDDHVEQKASVQSLEVSRGDANNVRQKIGMTLRNLLKLPKAQRWVFFEWFYSNIDRALFYGNNDFTVCLKESFSHLKTTMLTRTEWCVIRRKMGKPRRCSQAFFSEERRTLEKRRDAIRMIQQRKVRDLNLCKDLPDRIPLQLSVNSRVTARLREPQAGLFIGKVDAVDLSNNTYRITFDRPGLGTHSVPDYEVLLEGAADMVSISTMHKRYLKYNSQPKQSAIASKPEAKPEDKGLWSDHIVANFPRPFYEMIVRICKIMREKRVKIAALEDMNNEAERLSSLSQDYPEDLQCRYAGVLIELERLNISLKRFLSGVQKYCQDLAPDICETVMLAPSYIRDKSLEEAKSLLNIEDNDESNNNSLSELGIELLALLITVQALYETKHNVHELQVLSKSISRIKSIVSEENRLLFQNQVEVHIQYVENMLNKDSSLPPLLNITKTSKS